MAPPTWPERAPDWLCYLQVQRARVQDWWGLERDSLPKCRGNSTGTCQGTGSFLVIQTSRMTGWALEMWMF